MRLVLILSAFALTACTPEGGGSNDDDAAPVTDQAVSDAAWSDVAPAPDAGTPDAAAEPDAALEPDAAPVFGDDIEMTAADFDCLLDWTPVRRFYITNKLGRLDETLAVANDPEGGVYPPGTVIQLVPGEAMVKRRVGWSPATNDWEFFFLDVAGDGSVEIAARGTDDVVNQFGGNCLDCHALAEPQWDFVCEQDHGCDPIPITELIIRNLQDSDPRCRP